ncbi:hypothetical protein TREMEDRAFT_38107 [Tremella mesenterica DSM 1558]|uniref:uncharacterized protein n=1 Tax=Tremella mesenterica (strain ATCC 24925 / CBS 8224 / DSM 1558 / NBRC 9311 / NRRL Y-6157 / RJB 2259-6 / UBC 559-6) TaxID=578456 RepID=UPI0003F4A1E2|nr:uncharacterized protein TREMEDRAFT_38107 [Tremella mesenterica DSM 1558]EIW70330.1 hypothetical protein TREMEDRAFT_38107 [Tremella mesenterica DSM 1558]
MSLPPLDRYVAMDCEMVGVRGGQALAKVGIVDHTGSILLDSYVFVHPQNVIDWRTKTSGIKLGDLDGAPTFGKIRTVVKGIVQDKIIVGHALFNDLAAVQHRHTYEDTRDTSMYIPFRKLMGVENEGILPSLKKLAQKVLGVEIQQDVHCPIEDARTTLNLFLTIREECEKSILAGEDIWSGVPASYERWYW